MEPDSPARPSDGTPEQVSAEVERLAAARGLGSYELGRRGMYLFSGGLVWTHRRRAESATWPDVDRLVTVGGLPPHQVPKASSVVTIEGREAFVDFRAGVDEFRDRLVAAVRAANRPVRPDVPTTGSVQGSDTPRTDERCAVRHVETSILM